MQSIYCIVLEIEIFLCFVSFTYCKSLFSVTLMINNDYSWLVWSIVSDYLCWMLILSVTLLLYGSLSWHNTSIQSQIVVRILKWISQKALAYRNQQTELEVLTVKNKQREKKKETRTMQVWTRNTCLDIHSLYLMLNFGWRVYLINFDTLLYPCSNFVAEFIIVKCIYL